MSHSELDYANYAVQWASGQTLPDNLVQLRRDIYGSELGYLTEQTLVNKDDPLGCHILLVEKASQKAVACAHVYPAETGEFADYSGLDKNALQGGVFITRVMVAKELRGKGLLKLMLYLACRQGRLWGRSRMFCYYAEGEKPTSQVLRYEPLPHLRTRRVVGHNDSEHTFLPGTQRLDIGLIRSYECMPPQMQLFVRQFFAAEAVETTEKRIKQFFQNPWFEKIYKGEFTRNHYIQTLSNWHQFVRLTTRILARAIALSESSHLRRHFINHLNGEIDHEVQVEIDLRALGADVDYVKNYMIPLKTTQKFMVIQESLLAFHQDPVTYLAVPFAIEGFSAHLDEAFVESLEKNISTWGLKNPRKATTFLRAHIVSDGGEDGHWQSNKEILGKVLTSEVTLQKFLNITHMTFDAMEECYSSWVSEPDFSLPQRTKGAQKLKEAA